MALLENKIGANEFIALQGEVVPPEQDVLLDDRQGADGTEKVLVGLKGHPFQLVSHADAVDYDDANQLLGQYKGLIELDIQQLIKGGFDYDDFDPAFRVQVLRVTALKILAITGCVGGLRPPSGGYISARWELIAVPFTPE
jgi:hypothetical protein